ncbi:hypothetical protein DDE74_31590 [Streptomyces lydicus]|uniref:Uncharacterized protein n=1 Tax=Streptomyces lydicus TaxID=47763 RepID=A0A3Q9KE55_9ACTN|nr:hypothetical protein [Streptomyces lydicus]AZS74869.1 hypothetical protein DDE74_31590 [Streptomyces lydicus]
MSTTEPGTDRLLVAELVGLLNDAEHYSSPGSTSDSRLAYLDRRAALLHRLVDALSDESSRCLAQDAEDRAEDVRARADALARECGDPAPAPRQLQ